MQGADNDGRGDQEWLPTREIHKVHEPDAALEIETSVCVLVLCLQTRNVSSSTIFLPTQVDKTAQKQLRPQ